MIFALIFILGCLEQGPIGLLYLFIGGCVWVWWHKLPAKSDHDRDTRVPLKEPYRAESDLGPLDFKSCEWEQQGDDSFTNIHTHVTFTRDIYGNWTADDDDGSGSNSEYYGWYRIED